MKIQGIKVIATHSAEDMNVCSTFQGNPSNGRGEISLRTTKGQAHGGGQTHRTVALIRGLLPEVLEDLPVEVLPLQLGGGSRAGVQHPQSHLETLLGWR